MTTWKLSVTNKTGSSKTANVMVFQTMPENLMMGTYNTAWRVVSTQDSVSFDLKLPSAFKFCVIDQQDDVERRSALYDVSYGQALNVLQTNAEQPPKVTIKSDESVPKYQIKVTNMSGNATKLEMALFKDDSKVVFCKDVRPGDFTFMAIKPTVYMSVVAGIKQGQEFQTDTIVQTHTLMFEMSKAKQFNLSKDKLDMKIVLTEKTSGQYVFTEM